MKGARTAPTVWLHSPGFRLAAVAQSSSLDISVSHWTWSSYETACCRIQVASVSDVLELPFAERVRRLRLSASLKICSSELCAFLVTLPQSSASETRIMPNLCRSRDGLKKIDSWACSWAKLTCFVVFLFLLFFFSLRPGAPEAFNMEDVVEHPGLPLTTMGVYFAPNLHTELILSSAPIEPKW